MIITTLAEATPDLQRIPDIEKISDATFWTLWFCDKDLDRVSGLFRHRTGNTHIVLIFGTAFKDFSLEINHVLHLRKSI